MAQNVAIGASIEATPMATDGFREPSAAYKPTPPPSMNAKNGWICQWNEPLKAIIIRMQVAMPTNRKNTVPRLTPIGRARVAVAHAGMHAQHGHEGVHHQPARPADRAGSRRSRRARTTDSTHSAIGSRIISLVL